MLGLHLCEHLFLGPDFGIGRLETQMRNFKVLFKVGEKPFETKVSEISYKAVGGQNEQAVLEGISESDRLILGSGSMVFIRVIQAGYVTMVAISYDAGLIANHFSDCVNILCGGYREQAMPHILVIEAIDKGFLGGSIFNDFVCGFLGILVEHKDQAEVGGGRPFKIEPVEHLGI